MNDDGTFFRQAVQAAVPKKQTFFPGHEDEATEHVPNTDGTNRCAMCGIPLDGRNGSMAIDTKLDADALKRAQQEIVKQLSKGATMSSTRISEMEMARQAYEASKMDKAMPSEVDKIRAELNRLAQVSASTSPRDRELAMQKARASAIESLIISLFYTDPRVHAALLADPKNDDPAENERELKRMWENNIGGYRTDTELRAHKMVEIMDARGKAALR